MSAKTIFVTGAAGFLGSHLADTFLKSGHRVIACDSLLGGERENVSEGVEFHQVDCTDLERMTAIMKGTDIVYHCAAAPYEGFSVFSPYLVTQSVVSASVSTITAAIRNGVERIVSCSSMARYGENKVPFTEDMPPRPQDPYGIGKLASEMFLRNLCSIHNVEWVICVPHNIYGPKQRYYDPFRNVVGIMINMMLQGRQPIIYGNGEQKRCFSYIADELPVLVKLGFERNVIGEVINIGPDDHFISINELARDIAELMEFDLNPVYEAGRPQEVMLANCSADKARRLLGYQPRYSLREGLMETIKWVSQKGPRPFEYHLPLEIINEKSPRTWTARLF